MLCRARPLQLRADHAAVERLIRAMCLTAAVTCGASCLSAFLFSRSARHGAWPRTSIGGTGGRRPQHSDAVAANVAMSRTHIHSSHFHTPHIHIAQQHSHTPRTVSVHPSCPRSMLGDRDMFLCSYGSRYPYCDCSSLCFGGTRCTHAQTCDADLGCVGPPPNLPPPPPLPAMPPLPPVLPSPPDRPPPSPPPPVSFVVPVVAGGFGGLVVIAVVIWIVVDRMRQSRSEAKPEAATPAAVEVQMTPVQTVPRETQESSSATVVSATVVNATPTVVVNATIVQ